jgi:hypothetical protein
MNVKQEEVLVPVNFHFVDSLLPIILQDFKALSVGISFTRWGVARGG